MNTSRISPDRDGEEKSKIFNKLDDYSALNKRY
jgi:hypothetical protein